MQPLTAQDIRASWVNCTKGEASSVALPKDFTRLDWDAHDVLGWRDPKAPQRGYLVTWRDDRPVGVALRAAESTVSRPHAVMCLLCRSLRTGGEVMLFAARRAGRAGRDGNTVGTYICTDLACSAHLRDKTPGGRRHADPHQSVDERAAGLAERLDAFVAEVVRVV